MHLRIGSCLEKPRNRRMLSTWLSYGDMFSLVERAFKVPRLGCPVIYGASQSTSPYWDNSQVTYLGWEPQDSSEPWREELEASQPRGPVDAPEALYHGGVFTAEPIHES